TLGDASGITHNTQVLDDCQVGSTSPNMSTDAIGIRLSGGGASPIRGIRNVTVDCNNPIPCAYGILVEGFANGVYQGLHFEGCVVGLRLGGPGGSASSSVVMGVTGHPTVGTVAEIGNPATS